MADLRNFLAEAALNRRDFVKRAAALGLAVPTVASILAACGGDDDDDDGGDPTATTAGSAVEPTATTQISVDLNATPTPVPAGATATVAVEPTATTGGEATKGGSLHVLRTDDADLHDPVLNDSNCVIWICYSVYQSLTKIATNGIDIEPGASESWEIAEDGLTYSFTLRQGLKFADGTDLSTDDVIWSMERARDTEDSPWSFTMAQAQEFSAPDASTVQVVLSEVYAPFLAAAAMFNSSIVSKAWVEANGVEALAGQSMGTGPFYLKEWKVGEYVLLARNEHYFEEGLPHLDEVKISIVPDANSQILQLQGGEIDGLVGQYSIAYNRVAELQQDPNLQVIISPAAYNYYARVNIANPVPNPPLDDIHVRKAMAHAIDYQRLMDTVQFGIAEPSNSILPRGALYWNPDQVSPEFDLEKAKAELAMSTAPEGFSIEAVIVAGNPQDEAVAISLQDMWAEINIELIITPVDAAVRNQRNIDGDYDVRLGGWTNDMIDPDQILSYFVVPDSSNNARTGYLDQEAADLVIAARKELDPEKRREMYYKVQELWLDGPLFYLFNIPYVDALGTHVKGYYHHPLGPWGFITTYIEE